jgi:hypothetical protein
LIEQLNLLTALSIGRENDNTARVMQFLPFPVVFYGASNYDLPAKLRRGTPK